MATVLDQIVAARRVAVREARAKRSLSDLERQAGDSPAPRRFAAAFPSIAQARRLRPQDRPAVIAEIKRASPSKGLIRKDFDPVAIGKSYEGHGASAVSVLTEEENFRGSLQHLKDVSATVRIPALRKDFFVDPYQIAEARAYGASAILIIAACTERNLASELRAAAREFHLDVLAEVHTRAELDEVLAWGDDALVGINNRDLHTFEVKLETSLELLPEIPENRRAVAESGLGSRKDLDLLREAGAGGFLIGESLMRASDPGEKLAELLKPV